MFKKDFIDRMKNLYNIDITAMCCLHFICATKGEYESRNSTPGFYERYSTLYADHEDYKLTDYISDVIQPDECNAILDSKGDIDCYEVISYNNDSPWGTQYIIPLGGETLADAANKMMANDADDEDIEAVAAHWAEFAAYGMTDEKE